MCLLVPLMEALDGEEPVGDDVVDVGVLVGVAVETDDDVDDGTVVGVAVLLIAYKGISPGWLILAGAVTGYILSM